MNPDPKVIFHINPHEAAAWRGRERLAIFTRLAEALEANSIPFTAIARLGFETRRAPPPIDGALHIVENGRMEGEGWLNTGLAYLLGFWHLDPHGIQAESQARLAVFEADSVNRADAVAFAKTLRARFAKQRLSRFNQTRIPAQTLPNGCVALFLQGRAPYQAGHCDLPMDQMIRTVCAGAGGRPVVVKPHPRAAEDGEKAIALAQGAGAEFIVTGANVHDLLAASAVCVSVNSAVAIEGFLHRKPAILFGQSDFASLATRAHDASDFPAALDGALKGEWHYSKMLYWYFNRHALELAAPDFETRMFAAFAKVGFSRDRLVK
jgi:hypothetical protein